VGVEERVPPLFFSGEGPTLVGEVLLPPLFVGIVKVKGR